MYCKSLHGCSPGNDSRLINRGSSEALSVNSEGFTVSVNSEGFTVSVNRV